ncbi:DUF7144 family membrane protein [Salinactinospora qingdaonensis]|uniref:DUF7144 domain-containing protein n=1 Tax=Salinactinospora qingdaonensis TaxID=702744 RepID=A0ABP7GDZ1_9ACTN
MNTRINGWAAFAAIMLLLVGVFNIVHGLVAIAAPEFFVSGEGNLLVFNFAAWGALLVAFGALMCLIAFGLLTDQTWARIVAIALAGINALGQLAFITAYPLWSLVVIAIDVLIIYGLTAGRFATTTPRTYEAGHSDAQTVPEPRTRGTTGHVTGTSRGQHARPPM